MEGSPYAIHAADLNGDGNIDLSLHSWNSFNLTNISTDGTGNFIIPDGAAANINLQATAPDDHVSFFGGVVVDIDGNGDDEIFYPNLQTGDVSILNYEDGEDVLQVTADNVVVGIIPGLSSLGITAADLDGDGSWELIGTGPGYSDGDFDSGMPAAWVNIVEFNGGDPEDPANYTVSQAVEFPADMYNGFHTLNNLDASTTASDNNLGLTNPDSVAFGDANPEFASKFANLGDADLDGINEVAFGIQGVRDSLYVLDQAVDSSYSVTSVASNDMRVFLRVMSGSGLAVSIDEERIILPDDYKLHANYPNPFNRTTTIGFTLPLNKAVSVKVYGHDRPARTDADQQSNLRSRFPRGDLGFDQRRGRHRGQRLVHLYAGNTATSARRIRWC